MPTKTPGSLHPWDLAAPARLLDDMHREKPFRPGEIRVAAVEHASADCTFLGQVTVVRDGRAIGRAAGRQDIPALYRAQKLLSAAVDRLPVARWTFDGVPTSTVVVVSARHGRVVRMADEWVWERALHFCNGLDAFQGPTLLLTEHGWLEPDRKACGRTPALPAPSSPPVTSASRTSSSRAAPD